MIKNLLVYLVTLFGTAVLVMISMIAVFPKAAESGGFFVAILAPVYGFLTYRFANNFFNNANKKMNPKIKWLIFLSIAVVTTVATPFLVPYLGDESNHLFRSGLGGLVFGVWFIFILPSFFLNLFVSYYLKIPDELSPILITVFVGLQFLVLAGAKRLVDKVSGKKKILLVLSLILLTLLIFLGLLIEYSVDRSLRSQFDTTPRNKQTATKSSTTAELKPVKQQIPGWLMYQSEYLSFEHPSRLKSCCGIQTTDIDSKEKEVKQIAVLGDVPETDLGSGRHFDGLAIDVDINPQKTSFDKYVENEKNAWKQNYLEFTQRLSEKTSESELIVNGQKGMILKGYTWFGADILYVPFPDNQKILIIAKTEKTAGSFTEFDQVLKTLRF